MEKALFICYPKCSTCKKAQVWLEGKNIEYVFRDIKLENPTREELAAFYKKSGLPLKKFFNTSGQLYRSMELSKKLPAMTDDEMLDLLSTDGMLVKRPIFVRGETVLVGFSEKNWEESL